MNTNYPPNDMDEVPDAEPLPVATRTPDRLPTPGAQLATATDMRVVEVSEALAPAYAKASTLELTDAEVAALMAPFPDSTVDIRPHDGLIFLSHIHISDRLNAVFKPGKWAMLCRKHWLEGGTLYGEYVMLIRGCYVGESVGGHQYQPNNPKTNYSDSLESTAAEALRRIAGKRLSCGSQVWHKDYATTWVSTYAEQVGGKWRKKSLLQSTADRVAQSSHPRSPATVQPPAKPAAPRPDTRPATPDERKAMLLAKLVGFEPEADKVFLEEGITMPGESFRDIGITTVERMTPDQMLALIKTVKMRKAESDQVPDAEVLDDGLQNEGVADPVGTVEEVSQKDGKTKAGKPWVRYSIKISGAGWTNTFSESHYKTACALQGQSVRYTFKTTDFGKDLLTIESAQENMP